MVTYTKKMHESDEEYSARIQKRVDELILEEAYRGIASLEEENKALREQVERMKEALK